MKIVLLYGMIFLYVTAGIFHFVHPAYYLNIMPPWLSFRTKLVFITGVIEVALGLLLLLQTTRKFSAWGIIFFLIAVFPANIQMAINYYNNKSPYLWIAIIRLPLQFVLIWWAGQYTGRKKY